MAKISRKELTRGTSLTTDHVTTPLKAAYGLLNDAEISQEQMDRGFGTFRVDIWTPALGSQFIGPLLGFIDKKPFSVPFMIPPTQDFIDISSAGGAFANSYELNEDTPHPILTELNFSWDQRAEGAAITDQVHHPGQDEWPNYGDPDFDPRAGGYLDYTDASKALNFAITLVEKTPQFFLEETALSRTEPDKEVFSYEIPADAFIGASFRANPFVVTGINRTLNPYKTYIMLFHCRGLFNHGEYTLDNNAAYVLSSMTISLKFRMRLLPRDIDDSPNTEVQNMPTVHRGALNKTTVIAIDPGVVTPIEADTTDGVSVTMDVVDTRMRERIHGGYSEASEARRTEIEDDACYDVISATLYGGAANGGISHGEQLNYPFYKAGVFEEYHDRAIIPIKYPFVLHHVILAWNWQCWSTGYSAPGVPAQAVNQIPTTAVVQGVQIGVNLGCGLQSDLLGFQNIAQLQMLDPLEGGGETWTAQLLDQIRVHDELLSITNGVPKRQWDMFHIPVRPGVINGKGFDINGTNGPPVWCGKSNQVTAWDSRVVAAGGRTGLNVGAAPPLGGQEQFIEIHMRIFFTGNAAASSDLNDIITGYGGHRVYLIGKKHLAAERNPR